MLSEELILGILELEIKINTFVAAKAWAPDKHAGKTSVLFDNSCGVFSGVTHLYDEMFSAL
jgi:hypothetical protein